MLFQATIIGKNPFLPRIKLVQSILQKNFSNQKDLVKMLIYSNILSNNLHFFESKPQNSFTSTKKVVALCMTLHEKALSSQVADNSAFRVWPNENRGSKSYSSRSAFLQRKWLSYGYGCLYICECRENNRLKSLQRHIPVNLNLYLRRLLTSLSISMTFLS